MKKWLFSLSVLGTSAVFAQNPLIQENKTWSCYGDYFFLNVKYQLGGDTIFNGKTFRKVLAHGSSVPFVFNADSADYKSAIREENGKVWVIEKGYITEQLLYDFNKNTGDTIRFYRPTGNINQGVLPHYVIGKIYKTNTVTINGIVRKRLYIHDPNMVNMLPAQALSQLDPQADVWIEGIGAKTGLFSRMPEWGVVGPQPYLLACVEQNGQSLYAFNSGYNASPEDPCFIIPPDGTGSGSTGGGGSGGTDTLILGIAADQQLKAKLFPNPAKEWVMISQLSNSRIEIGLYKSDGAQLFFQEAMPENQTYKLSIQNLPAGLYRLRLVQDGKQSWLRLIKE